MATPIHWGILGAGGIANTFASALPKSRTGRLAAVASRDGEKARSFAAKHGNVRAHTGYEALLADPGVHAVYIATPHPQHAAWCIAAARAGKHILCEKPITLNHAEAMVVAEAAREAGVFLMEAFMYRCHPQTRKIVDLIRGGAIGDVRMIQATFSFQGGFNAQGRLFSNELGGGGILDVGCYTTSIARLVAGAATGRPFADPLRVDGRAALHPETGVDIYAAAIASFPGDILAQLSTGVMLNQENVLRVFGTGGNLVVPSPYVPARDGGDTTVILTKSGQPAETLTVHSGEPLYALEADAVGDAIQRGEKQSPFMTVADTLGNMAALDAWRKSAGLVYASEKPAFDFPTVSRLPLRKRTDAKIPYLDVPGVSVPVSRLVMGCDNQETMPHASAMFDDFFERGGNTFDTAYIYGGGAKERLLGRWIARRGVRGQVAVLVKGAHTPECFPDALTRQLKESLERLQTDYADIYLMHRDNLDVPVGEFVDVLNEHARAGRIRAFGGSNWTLARLREARAYAEKKGLQPFHCVSNNFSLARMVSPVWDGCVSAADPAMKQWIAETKTTLLAWSSQARGFFTDRAHPDRKDDAELVRCWYSDDNFKRRGRAVELAKQKGVAPINIALAYVLNQPFPAAALIGPRLIAETVSTFDGVGLELTAAELRWLNLESDEPGYE
jgi:predicted dehydrogenase/aryl-alcohol dehydrogenase-like predicted oxidoreductase